MVISPTRKTKARSHHTVKKIDFPLGTENERTFGSSNSVTITAYKYIPGQIIKSSYEGSTWEIDMDKWVQYLQELTTRSVISKVVSTMRPGDELIPIIPKEFGSYTFSIYDQYFKPGGVVSRYFTVYDSLNKQIVEIRADAYAQNFDMSQNEALFKYTDQTGDYFTEIENIILLSTTTNQQQ